MTDADRPIGIFDSGVGGLTVVRELWSRLPNESVLYFGDTARVPYGPKSPATVLRYSREATSFLLARGVKMIVVACNTATAHAIEHLDRELPVPVIGVVEPGVRAAVRATRSRRVGVIGTLGTIASGAYDRGIRHHLPDARVFAQPCPLFVPLVEEGWVDHPATRLVAEDYLAPFRSMDIDTLILGCTHYPLLRPLIAEALGPEVNLVDAAAEAVSDVERILAARGLLRTGGTPTRAFVVSDSPLRFRETSRHFLGEEIGTVEEFDVEGYNRAA